MGDIHRSSSDAGICMQLGCKVLVFRKKEGREKDFPLYMYVHVHTA